MIITDGEKTMTLQEQAKNICDSFNADECDDKCPAAKFCNYRRNGMMDCIGKVIANEQD